MTHRLPALLTLLGLAATAGCQGRDKLRTILAKVQVHPARVEAVALPDRMRPRRHAPCLACTLQTGLAELYRRLAEGSVAPGCGELSSGQLRRVLGAPVIDELASKTGLSEPELLARLARGLPETVALMDAVDAMALPLHAVAEHAARVESRC